MNALFAAATEIQHFLQSRCERYCFIGGVALQRLLDWNLVFEEFEPLAAVRDVPGFPDRLRQLRNSVSQQE